MALALGGGLGLGAVAGRTGIAPAEGPARFVAAVPWPVRRHWHGGFSAIETDAGGTRALVLSDSGYMARARLERDAAGRLVAVDARRYGTLMSVMGRPLTGIPDPEGLATPPGRIGGRTFVTLEWNHRILAYDDLARRPEVLPVRVPRPEAWRGLRGNRGPEAAAQRADGALLVLMEGAGAGGHLVTLLEPDGTWRDLAPLPRSGWAPVGADFGPDGRLYLLERRFVLAGFRSRVRRFDLGSGGLEGPETLLVTPLGRHGNLEGLAVWARGGGIRLTMIADDNYQWFQRGDVVEYALDPPAADR